MSLSNSFASEVQGKHPPGRIESFGHEKLTELRFDDAVRLFQGSGQGLSMLQPVALDKAKTTTHLAPHQA